MIGNVQGFLPFGFAQQDTIEDSGDDVAFDVSTYDVGVTFFGRVHVREQLYVSSLNSSTNNLCWLCNSTTKVVHDPNSYNYKITGTYMISNQYPDTHHSIISLLLCQSQEHYRIIIVDLSTQV